MHIRTTLLILSVLPLLGGSPPNRSAPPELSAAAAQGPGGCVFLPVVDREVCT
ncbi:hypothetical protein [Euzebya rosea]|uniref:hypothetical protein n=1 Tax=Euzebya rosea TaxID=2052804 RepID=UPI001300A9F8|nr:hypothetical protein [Euzebya rosea]